MLDIGNNIGKLHSFINFFCFYCSLRCWSKNLLNIDFHNISCRILFTIFARKIIWEVIRISPPNQQLLHSCIISKQRKNNKAFVFMLVMMNLPALSWVLQFLINEYGIYILFYIRCCIFEEKKKAPMNQWITKLIAVIYEFKKNLFSWKTQYSPFRIEIAAIEIIFQLRNFWEKTVLISKLNSNEI